jgi:hypothetical protein
MAPYTPLHTHYTYTTHVAELALTAVDKRFMHMHLRSANRTAGVEGSVLAQVHVVDGHFVATARHDGHIDTVHEQLEDVVVL